MWLPKLVTDSDGLAFHCWTSAGPSCEHGYRTTGATRQSRGTAGRYTTKHAESHTTDSYTGGWYWRHSTNPVRLEGMEEGRSDADQQPLAEQNGKRDQEAIRKCRGLHNAGPLDRPGHSSDRMLAVRQLLVSRTRRSSCHGSLTKAETPTEASSSYQRGQCVVIVAVEAFKSRERLALGRGV